MDQIIEFSQTLITKSGYWGIIILMALESTATPVISEIVMGFAGFFVSQGIFNFYLASLAGAFGSLIGSIFSYLIGYFLYNILKRNLKFNFFLTKINLSENLIQKYGLGGIFLGRFLPGIRHFISFPAGFFKINFFYFSLLTFLGSFIWCSFLVWLGRELKENWFTLKYFFFETKILILALFVILIILFWLILKKRIK